MATVRLLELRRRGVRCASLVAVLCTIRCAGITVTGEVIDDVHADLVRTVSLSRNANNVATGPRVLEATGTDGEPFLGRCRTRIRVKRQGDVRIFGERYHYLVFSTPRQLYEGGVTQMRSQVADQIGHLINVSATLGTPSLQSSDSGGLHIGKSWLIVVQPDDRIVPWTIQPNASNCFPMPAPNDCFDVQSLARTIFETVDNSVAASVTQIAGVRVIKSSLNAVPRVIHHDSEASGAFRRARGFGFIYEVQLIHDAGAAQVFVPINFILADDEIGYRLLIDPVALARGQARETIEGILIKGTGFTSLFESQIRERVVEAVDGQTLPDMDGVDADKFILAAIGGAAGNVQFSPGLYGRYEVVLIPESVEPTARPSTILERTAGRQIIELRPMKIVFLE